MGVFHVFKIVQMVPNRVTHHIVCSASYFSSNDLCKKHKIAKQKSLILKISLSFLKFLNIISNLFLTGWEWFSYNLKC